jgi:hypothetical protein
MIVKNIVEYIVREKPSPYVLSLGLQYQKEMEKGIIFSTFISSLLAYVPPKANRVGAQCFMTAIANLSVESYTDLPSEGSCADEKKVPLS